MDDYDECEEYILQEIATEYAKCFPDVYASSENDGLQVDE